MTRAERAAYDRATADGAAWFESLPVSDKWAIGDALVLGGFDWRDWFADPPPPGFRRGIVRASNAWEAAQ